MLRLNDALAWTFQQRGDGAVSERGLLDLKEAAGYLSISTRSLERIVSNDDIEVVRLPGVRKLLFRPQDLEKLIRESRIVPATVPAFGRKVAVLAGRSRT